MSELADETDSKSVIRTDVWVRAPPPAYNGDLAYLSRIPVFGLFKPNFRIYRGKFFLPVYNKYRILEQNMT